MLNNVNYDIDITKEPPADDTARQYYFIEKAKAYVQRESEELGRPLTFCVTTFGCQMNARDSEKLCGILEKIGYVEATEDEADFIIFNTCTVRENANMRVYGRLGQLKPRKKKNPSYSYVDIIFGTHNIFKFAELIVTRFESQRMVIDIWKDTDKIVENLPNDRKFSFKSGVNIMFGCNNFCSYCIVPYVRGRERSRDPEAIISEIRQLVADGVVEVMLLGQNVNSYGKNLEHPITFAQLLERIEQIEGLERIRFMTSHPKDLSDELIEVMGKSKKICKHLHLPVQSGSSKILKKMNRHYTKEQYLELVEKIRRSVPDISLTTDIIVGFPGETEEDFEETMDIVRKVRYDSAFTFIYSKRTGTPAAVMEDQVPEDVVKNRFDRLLKEVHSIASEVCSVHEGTVQTALIESVSEHDPSMVTGRLSNNLLVHIKGDKGMIGRLADVRLTECKGFYYLGELAE